jgi:hypothetical protein
MADPRQPRKWVDTRAPGKDKGAHGDGNVPCTQASGGKLGGAVDLAVGKGVDEKGDECRGESLSVNMGTLQRVKGQGYGAKMTYESLSKADV